ncbi:MAG TPA: L,D-transpeptidase family protein [Caulobacteraceae bacterium]|jgi:murein L,D-transpeptidase YcbB/YkuD
MLNVRLAALGLAGLAVGLSLPAWAQEPTPPLAGGPPAEAAIPQPRRAPAPDVALSPGQVDLLRATLERAPAHGFEPGEFGERRIDELLDSPDPAERREGETRLIAATLRYAKAVKVGRLPEDGFLEEWGLRPAAFDPAPGFVRAAADDRLQAWLATLPPPYSGYDSLQGGLARYRALAAKGGWKRIPEGEPLQLGSSGARVAALRARLAVEDPSVAAGGATFDAPLHEAVIRAQKRYGLLPDGVVAANTLTALNLSVERRVEQIVANMERWRWMPAELPADRVQVNVAAAILTIFREDKPVMSMRAVTGRPGDETPLLQSRIHSIVLNPPWNVPTSIATKELWPKQKANPGYFAANDFIVIKNDDGSTRLQQKAGDKAALGRVKFDFANPYGVYLHDTPARSKFASYSRLASHGCVRLEKPVPLAKLLLGGSETWTPEAIEAALEEGKTVRAQLPRDVTVLLFYWTAYVTPDGQVNFRGDPYGWDKELMQRIAAGRGVQA